MNKICLCDEECFTFFDASNGVRHYKCFNYEDPCEYHFAVQIYPMTKIKKKEKKRYNVVKKQTKEEKLKILGENFMLNQRFATFQEIEQLANEKFKNGDIVKWIQRICNLK